MKIFALIFFLQVFAGVSFAEEAEEEPLWEYGIGLGGIRYYHYPAAAQFRDVGAVFPTFQYRGEILRADDREGARAYLIHEKTFSLEMGGGLLPAVSAEDNEARQGMDALPWGLQLGPQLVMEPRESWELKVGVYQAVTTDLKMTKTTGFLSKAELVWRVDDDLEATGLFGDAVVSGRLGFEIRAATQDFLKTYFEVEPKDATSARPAYAARGGFLSYELSYLHKMTWGRTTVYAGVADQHFDLSANKESPLHRQNENMSLFFGLAYSLRESKKLSVPEDKARGLLERR